MLPIAAFAIREFLPEKDDDLNELFRLLGPGAAELVVTDSIPPATLPDM